MLSDKDVAELTEFRRELHRYPEISGEETRTANMVVDALKTLAPTTIIQGLGGNGVAAVFDSGNDGETVMFRAELDALPIQEISNADWKSKTDGKAHLCGHDGHMTMLLALGRILKQEPISSGRVVLLFQPAEEDGSGARLVVDDKRYEELSPDWAFAIHNLPGHQLGCVAIKPGLMNCASLGLSIALNGKTAHAASPEDGTSPVLAIGELIPSLNVLGDGGPLNDEFRLSTITHISVGEPSFGISPSSAKIFVTLRAAADSSLAQMVERAKEFARKLANAAELELAIEERDIFAASINDDHATRVVQNALEKLQIPCSDDELPMRASEDFGIFGWASKSAMLCLGSGENCPALHNPDFDFPDTLIPIGASIFERIARDLLG